MTAPTLPEAHTRYAAAHERWQAAQHRYARAPHDLDLLADVTEAEREERHARAHLHAVALSLSPAQIPSLPVTPYRRRHGVADSTVAGLAMLAAVLLALLVIVTHPIH